MFLLFEISLRNLLENITNLADKYTIYYYQISLYCILFSKFHMCFSHTHSHRRHTENIDTYIYIQKKNNISNDGTRISPAHFIMSDDVPQITMTKYKNLIIQTTKHINQGCKSHILLEI